MKSWSPDLDTLIQYMECTLSWQSLCDLLAVNYLSTRPERYTLHGERALVGSLVLGMRDTCTDLPAIAVRAGAPRARMDRWLWPWAAWRRGTVGSSMCSNRVWFRSLAISIGCFPFPSRRVRMSPEILVAFNCSNSLPIQPHCLTQPTNMMFELHQTRIFSITTCPQIACYIFLLTRPGVLVEGCRNPRVFLASRPKIDRSHVFQRHV